MRGIKVMPDFSSLNFNKNNTIKENNEEEEEELS
jgi:hypothetical protein